MTDSAKVSQEHVEVGYSPAAPRVRVSQEHVEVGHFDPAPRVRVSQVVIEVAYHLTSVENPRWFWF